MNVVCKYSYAYQYRSLTYITLMIKLRLYTKKKLNSACVSHKTFNKQIIE